MTAAEPTPARAACPAAPAIPTQQQFLDDVTGVPVSTTASLSTVPAPDEAEATQPASPPGIVAGTVLRAARLSAHLAQAQLAVAIGANEESIAGWEDGTDPLTAVPYPVLERLEAELTAAKARPDLVTDLTIAIWCDLVVAAVAASDDITCLMADPTAAEDAFSELLAWSAGGQRPERYRSYAGAGPLLQTASLDSTASTIRKLSRARRSAYQSAA